MTTNYIADETITMAKNRLGYKVAVKIGQMLWDEDIATLIRITSFDENNAWKIFTKYQDKGFSFTDCTSFAVMERLGIIESVTFDEHFNQYSDFIPLD